MLQPEQKDNEVLTFDKDTSDEKPETPLIFSDVSMGFLHTFYLNLDDKFFKSNNISSESREYGTLDLEKITQTLNEKFIKIIGKYKADTIKINVKGYIEKWDCKENEVEWIHNDPIAEDFKATEQFFSDHKTIFAKHFRFELGNVYIKYPRSPLEKNISPLSHEQELGMFLNIYPNANVANLLFTLKFQDKCDCNDVIFLRQHFMENRHGLCTKEKEIKKHSDNIYDCFESINDSLDKVKSAGKTGQKEHYYEWIKDNRKLLKKLPRKIIYKQNECRNISQVSYSPVIIQSISETFCLREEDVYQDLYRISKDDNLAEECIVLIQKILGKENDENNKNLTDDLCTNIIEIRRLSSCVCTSDCEEYLIQTYPKQIYSLLVGDEGWKYVPRRVAMSRIGNRAWSSRGFFSVFALDKSVLLFNFIKTNCYEQYVKEQKNLSGRYRQLLELYFNKEYKIPGAQHSPFFWLEIYSIMKWYSDNIFKGLNDIDKYYDFLSEFNPEKQKKKLRKSKKSIILTILKPIISITNLVIGENEIKKMAVAKKVVKNSILNLNEVNKIWEVNQLGILINNSLSISDNINKLEVRSNSINDELSIKYQIKTNRLMGILAFLGVILTSLGLVLTL
ncbi:hypothetical protein [Methanosarcina siciliae]|uniref:hypothetical protein n=1 Tax=Methanosarcina siciliae TaxID=38027 RepID=UPI000B0E62F9|nr:hypothetical protein [Methanosarcina siciliae]